jgi:Zn-dependent peptidase ImmA (M78 family)/plasmid maintenance system antidote protein VapI
VSFNRAAFANKLRRFKEHLAVNDQEIAVGTGISESRLSTLLAGSADPTGDEVLILADFFDCDYKFFISAEKLAAFEQTDSLYRKHGAAFSKQDRRSVQQFLYLCECEAWLWKTADRKPYTFSFSPKGPIFKKHGEQAARELRKHLGYAEGKIPSDLFRDLRRIGIHVFRRKLVNSNVSGVMIWHPSAGRCVLVNYHEDLYRQRFTAAHELAHALMEDSEVNVSFSNDGANLAEIRANVFASHYLVPPEFLKGISVGKNGWTQTDLNLWAGKLTVSTQMLRIALKEYGLITNERFDELKSDRIPRKQKIDPEIASESGRTRERKSALLERGLSFHYVNECMEALRNGYISHARAAEMMLISEDDLPEITALFAAGGER